MEKRNHNKKGRAVGRFASGGASGEEIAYKLLPEGPNNGSRVKKEVYKAQEAPVALGASAYQAGRLYKGSRVIMSSRDAIISWKVHQLILCCFCGILAGVVGGLLGPGGGFILGPLLLELGIPPQLYLKPRHCSAQRSHRG